jgi:hypothetical protein
LDCTKAEVKVEGSEGVVKKLFLLLPRLLLLAETTSRGWQEGDKAWAMAREDGGMMGLG